MKIRLPRGVADAGIAVLLMLAAFALYLATVAPSVTAVFDDSLEFQVVAYTLGIAHPTGYPLYTLLGWLVTRLPAEPAYLMNMMSAFFGAMTVGFIYAAGRQLWCYRASAAAGAIALAVSSVFWSQAVITEVYTLNAALMAAVVWLALRVGGATEDFNKARKRAYLLAVVYGLSLTHHRMSLLLLPPLLGYLWWLFGRQLRLRHWLRLAALMALPLLFYLYIPIRGSEISSLDGSYTNTLGGFLRHVTATGYNVFLQGNPLGRETLAGGDYLRLFRDQFGIAGLALAVVGLVFLLGRGGQRLFLGTILILNFLFALSYNVADYEVFFIPSFVSVALLISLGLDLILKVSFGIAKQEGISWAAGGSVFAVISVFLLLLPVPTRWLLLDRSVDWSVRDLGDFWLQAASPGSAVVGILGETTLMRYLQLTGAADKSISLYPADDEALRLDLVRRLVSRGQETYLTRSLPGVTAEFSLDAAGPLVRVSPVNGTASNIGRQVAPGFNLVSWQWQVNEKHGRSYVSIKARWLTPSGLDRRLKVSARTMREGAVISGVDAEPVHNTYPTTEWRPGEVIEDYYRIDMPVGDAGGDTELVLVLYDAATGLEEGRIDLGKAALPPSTAPRPVAQWGVRALNYWLEGGYRLVGTSLSDSLEANAGTALPLTLLWANDSAPATGERTLVLSLIRENATAASEKVPLVYSGWPRGHLLRQNVILALPGRMESGNYRLILSDVSGGGVLFRQAGWPPLLQHVTLANVRVIGRTRTFDSPQPTNSAEVVLSKGETEIARLLGYDIERSGNRLNVVLYWQALSGPDAGFKVFVHAVDASGAIIAQDDSVPAQGSAPTTSWVTGEFVIDPHELLLPDSWRGKVQLLVGMYDPASNNRLAVTANLLVVGGNAVSIAELEP